MSKKTTFNRQKEDYLISDILPFEKGNFFTNKYFYEYILDNKKTVNKITKGIKAGTETFDSKWHSSPLKFKVKKKNNLFREISIMNPLGSLESLIFMECFEKDILNIIHNKKSFSVRKPQKVNSLVYKKVRNQKVFYTNDLEKKQLLLSLESSGSYFNHKPFKKITDFYNSNLFSFYQDKFSKLLSIDIQDCFPSIYTHSFKWLISKKTYDSKNLGKTYSVYKGIDSFLQNLNGSKTNGILVGPEMMRLLAEFLLVHIDERIMERLFSKNIINEVDYKIFRFVDDYFIFTDNSEVEKIISNEISAILNQFHLKVNDKKFKQYDNSFSFNKWIYETQNFTPLIEKIMIEKKDDDFSFDNLFKDISDLGLTEENSKQINQWIKTNLIIENKRAKYNDLRNRFLILLENTNEITLTSSYVLSVILNIIERSNDTNHKLNINTNDLVLMLFFVYSKDVTYTSTQKLIRTLTLLKDKFNLDIKESVEKCYERFDSIIFSNYKNDWIDLLVFSAIYNIQFTVKRIASITSEILQEENPILIAGLCLYYNSIKNTKNINAKVNKIIRNNLSKTNWNDLFQDEKIWFILIFYSYSGLNLTVKREIKLKLKKNIENLESTSRDDLKSVCLSQKLILEFILNKDKHFIEWDFVKDNYYSMYHYFTKDRTIFNPGMLSQLQISR
ncbi:MULTISPECIES: RNA-directed DNA polymerase [unclassified Exiguobacterium]|uniref:RNA-directed DNA polymerase n=1 Tax=unclassified Exiguobacterium TaxID=2644629 RepID=UPI001BE52EE2|nr:MULTISPECIES: RNA-directed DNA polymerase [unclassified Exiguobacterium]